MYIYRVPPTTNSVIAYMRARLVPILDHFIFLLVLILVLLPMSRLPWGGSIRGANVEAPLQIAVAVVLIVRIIIASHTRNGLPLFYFSFMVVIYLSLSIIILGVPLSVAVQHLRQFFPFFIACLLLWAGTSVAPDKILYGLSISIGASALLIIYIVYFNPHLLLFAYGDQYERYLGIVKWGRTFWRSTNVVLFSIMAFMEFNTRSKTARVILLLSVVLATVGLLSTFSRTHIVAFLVFVFINSISAIRNRRNSNIIWIILFAGALLYAVDLFFSIDQKLLRLFQGRIMSLFSAITFSNDISLRMVLYRQYIDRFLTHFILGQGLGVPFISYPVVSYHSDVTLVSFGLPFGIIGVFSLVIFVYTLFKSLAGVKNSKYKSLARLLTQLTIIGLIVSLNDDIWARKIFVICLALVTASIDRFGRERLPGFKLELEGDKCP